MQRPQVGKKVTNQSPLTSCIHLQDRKTSNHQSDNGIHVIIGNRAWPSLNGGSLKIIIVYLTSLKIDMFWDTSLNELKFGKANHFWMWSSSSKLF